MEPRDRAPQEVTAEEAVDPWSVRSRLRLAAGCVLLIGLAFVQAPGFQVADTKFDLVADPVGFLGRAVHLWDAGGAFGQVQNQAYGYLWPMGPFFAVLHELGLQGWVVQRLWLALVLCVAFLGAAALARALGVRSDVALLLGATAYALSPRMVSTLGPISIEAWPSAVAPWVLLPLVLGSRRGSARRSALQAGLAVAMVGGVNAAATFAVLPLGMLWLLTRRRGPRRRTLLVWWPVFTFLGTAWWLVPLLLLGRFSPPFLDYIETASVTTFPTTLFDSLRGTTAWVPYVDPSWVGGNELLTTYALQLNTGLVLLLGVAGIAMRDNPHRRFLGWSVVLGLTMLTAGHLGAVHGWFADPLHTALDGVLAPLRNVHKFDPVVRLPLVMGLAWSLDSAVRRTTRTSVAWRGRQATLASHVSLVALALVGVAGAGLPALDAHLTPVPPTLGTPSYWNDTVRWLDARTQHSVALLAPGTGFADYLWGSPRDEPVQYLSARSWGVRNAIPLAPPGNIRMLDAFEARMEQGRGSAGLADYLRRAGVGYVVVRNDLRPGDDVPSPVLVRRALTDSPGLSLVQTFGPQVGGGASLVQGGRRLVVDDGWQTTAQAVEVYRVADSADVVSADSLTTVVGGPEDLLDLADADALPAGPTRLAVDGAPRRPQGPWVLTDGLLRRERFFGRSHDAYSSVLTAGDRARSGNPTPDYLPPGAARWQTRARLTGAKALSASSSESDSNTVGGTRTARLPYAAVDGDLGSEWVSGQGSGPAPPWWSVELSERQPVSSVLVTLGNDGAASARLRVRTDGGVSRTVDFDRGETRSIPVDAPLTASIRVESVGAQSGRLALAEVGWPGRAVSRPLVLPRTPASWTNPSLVVLRTLSDARTGCLRVEDRVPCVEGRDVQGEEPTGFDRELRLASSAVYPARVSARPLGGGALYAALQRGLLLSATGSTVAVPDARASGIAAVDGDPGTSWTPTADDSSPRLALNWVGKRTIRGLRFTVEDDAPVRRPTSVVLTSPAGTRRFAVDSEGRASFRPVRTDRVVLTLASQEQAASIDSSGAGSALPVGVGEVRLTGLPTSSISLGTTVRRWACGTGPSLWVDGRERRTRLVASPADVYAMRSVPAAFCDGDDVVGLEGGSQRIRSTAGTMAVADKLLLGEAPTTGPVTAAASAGDPATGRSLSPGSGSQVVVERSNTNPGWAATQSGRRLRPVVVDGWQRGWLTDGTRHRVETRFGPDTLYRVALLLGGLLFLTLLLLAASPRRWWRDRAAPALTEVGGAWTWQAGVALLAGGLLGSWTGLLVALVGVVLGRVLGRWERPGPWWVALPVLVASAAYAVRPWGDAAGWAGAWAWPAYLVLLAVAATLVVGEEPPQRRRSRSEGTSTTR